jgi:integrase
LLLRFLQKKTGRPPSSLSVADLDAPNILEFLDHLEKDRNNQVCSRNVRLTALRSFFQVIALRDPASLGIVTRVLAIPFKRTERHLVGFLTTEQMDAILAAPDQSTWAGRRDYALLLTMLTMYNSGARSSEMTNMCWSQVKLEHIHSYLQILGKGRKERTIPLWPDTVEVLRRWLEERGGATDAVVFPSGQGVALSGDGLNYILQQAVNKAVERCSSLKSKRVTPHMFRHSAAMALLQSGVHIEVIALYLGHEHVQTTRVYVEADLAMKEEALKKIVPTLAPPHRFRAADSLLAFLESL